MAEVKYPDVTVQLTGDFREEAMQQQSYDAFLAFVVTQVEVQ